jgi:hypothetical protein
MSDQSYGMTMTSFLLAAVSAGETQDVRTTIYFLTKWYEHYFRKPPRCSISLSTYIKGGNEVVQPRQSFKTLY